MLSKKISKLNNAVYIFHVFSYVWVLGFHHVSHRVFTLPYLFTSMLHPCKYRVQIKTASSFL